MFTNDKSALLQSLLFPVLIIIWGIARTVTDFLYAGGISAFTRLDALWRYVCFGAIICSVIAIIITLCGKVDTSRYFLKRLIGTCGLVVLYGVAMSLPQVCFLPCSSELRVLLIRYSECRTMIQVKRSVRYLCCLTRLFILRCSGGSNGYLNLLKRNNIRRNSIKTVPPFLYIICKRKTALIMIIKAVGTPRGIRTLITPKVFLCYQQYEP